MLTQDGHHNASNKRMLSIPFYLAVSVVLLICGMLTIGAVVLSTTNNLEKSPRRVLNDWTANLGWKESKGVRIRTALTKLPARYLASIGGEPELPKLVIDIRFKNQEMLRVKRENALKAGMLIQEEGDLVSAEVRTDDRQVRVKLRLKGDQPDHFDSDKWSLRIEVKGSDHILGMRRFSLQHPKVRGYHAEPLFMETLKHLGVLGVRYQFVHVVINGEDKGIMALEEHFSKELLENQARREGVFIRFDETNFWDFQRAGGQWRSSPYDNFRESRITTFRGKKVEESPLLSAQYAAATGLMRSFAAGEIAAAEVFDIETTANYLAALELWGSWHGIQWNDMRFYFDPLSMKLEPVGYDANLQLHSDLKDVTLRQEPIYAALLADPEIRAAYLASIRKLARDVIDGELGTGLAEQQAELLDVLQYEFLLLEPLDLDNLAARAEFLLTQSDAELLQDPTDYPRRIRFPAIVQANVIASAGGQYIELANLVAEPVTVRSAVWRNQETGETTPATLVGEQALPLELLPTVQGSVPSFKRLSFERDFIDGGEELVLRVTYPSWPEEREVVPQHYRAGLTENPVPKSTVAAELARHPFLSVDEASRKLLISKGDWSVASDLIVPAGFTLSASAATTLTFAPDAALISYGPLEFIGTEDEPVRISGFDGHNWPGLAVLHAETTSVFRWVQIEGTRGINRDAWYLTGGVSFYKSDVDFADVSISHHDGEDALNVVRAHFDITRLRIFDALSDGFDGDFTTGLLTDSEFASIGRATGGDAVDFSGSDIRIDGMHFSDIADKAVSVGEASRAEVSNISMTDVGTAAASKDGSYLEIDGMQIDSVVFAGLMAYTKKPEYGPARIKARNVEFKPSGPVGRVQTDSEIELDGKMLATEDLDVDLLYETIMRKGGT